MFGMFFQMTSLWPQSIFGAFQWMLFSNQYLYLCHVISSRSSNLKSCILTKSSVLMGPNNVLMGPNLSQIVHKSLSTPHLSRSKMSDKDPFKLSRNTLCTINCDLKPHCTTATIEIFLYCSWLFH